MQNKRNTRTPGLVDLGAATKATKGAVKGNIDTLGQPQNRFGIADD